MATGYNGRFFFIHRIISEIQIDDKITLNASTAHTNHRGDFIEILYFIDGNTSYFIEGDFYPLEVNDVVFSNASEIHGIVHRGSCRYERYVIKILPEFFIMNGLEKIYDNLNNKYPGEGNYINHSSVLGKLLHTQFVQLEKYLSTSNVSVDLINGSMIEIVNLLGSQVYSKSGKFSNPLLRKIMMYIRENVHNDIGLKSIAEEFHVDRTHLARVFKQLTNCTVHQYITIMRLDHAEQFRRYSHMSRSEAARAVGFKNYSTYYRAYKKYNGTAPKKDDPLRKEDVFVNFEANN